MRSETPSRAASDSSGTRGSRTVLTSPVSRLPPIPDAALGALGYLVDAATGVIGRRDRWRTMPWIVLMSFALFGRVLSIAFGGFDPAIAAGMAVEGFMIGLFAFAWRTLRTA